MSASETMLAAVAGIENMLDLTGAIITNPERVGPRVSTAEVLALALATEGLWALAIENALLLKVLQDTVPMPPPALAKRINAVAAMVVKIRGEIPSPKLKEARDANSN
jgi:hypothetical protein